MAAGLDDVRRIAVGLPRAYEAIVRDSVKFRVGSIVFAAVSPDESLLGFGFPREEREALVASNPITFLMPADSDLRYQWVRLRLAEIDALLLPADVRPEEGVGLLRRPRQRRLTGTPPPAPSSS